MKALSSDEILEQSQRVWTRLAESKIYQNAKSIGIFLSMPSGEINTDPAIEHAVATGKVIYIPKVGKNFEEADMNLYKVVTDPIAQQLFHRSWTTNKWGIPEPPDDLQMDVAQPGDLDVILVPGLAFTRHGDRLGQGKGYYDRFIERMMLTEKKPILIAVGLDCQLVDNVPTHEHDCRVNIVLLPSETIEVSSPSYY